MRRLLIRATLPLVALFGVAGPAAAQELPPMPESLIGASLSACLRVDDKGTVNDAFLTRSTGDAARDRDAVAWLKQLRWPPREPGGPKRISWVPMDILLGDAAPPSGPKKSCPPD